MIIKSKEDGKVVFHNFFLSGVAFKEYTIIRLNIIVTVAYSDREGPMLKAQRSCSSSQMFLNTVPVCSLESANTIILIYNVTNYTALSV